MPRRRRSTHNAHGRSDRFIPRDELEVRRRDQDLRDARYVYRQLQDPFVQWRIREAFRQRAKTQLQLIARQPASNRRVRARVDLTTGEIINPETWFDRDQAVRDVLDDQCKRAKEDRRGAVIAGGYGGRNGARNYRKQEKC